MSRIRADQILNGAGTGAPNFSLGLQVGAATTIHTTGIDLGSGNIQSHNINSTGIITATSGTFSGNVSIGGTLTYEDVTSIDSVGVITARNGIHIPGGGNLVGIGTTNPESRLHVYGTHNSHIRMTNTSDDGLELVGDANRSGQDQNILSIKSRWNGTDVAKISFKTGSDTTDKDDADIAFYTKDSGSSIAERLRITSGGKIGIGIVNPAQMLEINNTAGTGSQIQLKDTSTGTANSDGVRIGYNGTGAQVWNFENTFFRIATNDTERLRITSAGEVIIGDTSSSTVNSTQSILQIINPGAPSRITTIRTEDGANGSGMHIAKSRNGGAVQNNDQIGGLFFNGHDGTDLAHQAAQIVCDVDGTPGSNDMPGRLVFKTTADGTSSPTERLRIGSSGQIGLAGANYGTSGQIIKSNGSSAAPTWQNLYSFMFYGEQDTQHGVANAIYTAIVNLGSRDFSVGDSSIAVFNESAGTLTIGASGAGYWFLSMGAGIDDVQANDFTQCVIGKNGGSTDRGTVISSYSRGWNSGTANQVVTANTSCMVNLNANDVVRFYVYHNEGTNENTEPNRTFAMGYRIG